MSFAIRRVLGSAERDAALALRHRVFCEEQGVPEQEERDGRDEDGLHLVAIDADAGQRVIGTCRLLFVGGTVQFSRLAVEEEARRHGVAGALLSAAEDEARAAGVKRMVLHAQTYAQELYRGAGWEARGARFVEAGIEHVAMEKALA